MGMDALKVTLWRWLETPSGKGWWLDFAETTTVHMNHIIEGLVATGFAKRNELCWNVGRERPTVDPYGHRITQ